MKKDIVVLVAGMLVMLLCSLGDGEKKQPPPEDDDLLSMGCSGFNCAAQCYPCQGWLQCGMCNQCGCYGL